MWSTGRQVNLSEAEVIDSHPFATTRCLLESWHIQRHLNTLNWEQVFRVKKLVGRRWGAPNSNYLLAIGWPGTFVVPFSITINASHAHIKQTHMHTQTHTDTHRHIHTRTDTPTHIIQTQTYTRTHTHHTDTHTTCVVNM